MSENWPEARNVRKWIQKWKKKWIQKFPDIFDVTQDMRFSNNESEKNRIFGFEKNGGNHIFSQNCLVTLVITASFEFWFLVRSQLAPRFLRESFLLNSKLILNQNPCWPSSKNVHGHLKTYMCTKKCTYCRSIPFHMICKGRIMIIVIDLPIRTHRSTLYICRHRICIFS